jgi:hypothetical protein
MKKVNTVLPDPLTNSEGDKLPIDAEIWQNGRGFAETLVFD